LLLLIPAVSRLSAQSPSTSASTPSTPECRGMESVNATIADATRCAKAKGWVVHPYWTQISDWYGADRGNTTRIMCAAPRVRAAGGRNQLFYATRSIYQSPNDYGRSSSDVVFSYLPAPSRIDVQAFNHRTVETFDDATSAGNAACSPLHLPEKPDPQR
jgi:hypothetical protein